MNKLFLIVAGVVLTVVIVFFVWGNQKTKKLQAVSKDCTETNRCLDADNFVCVECDASSKTLELNIPFTIANNYFVRSDYKDAELHGIKLFSQASLDSVFGMATLMGNNGAPTKIDFSKQYVIALIGKEADIQTTLKLNSLIKVDHSIIVNYTLLEGEKSSATARPVVLILVDKQIQGNLQLKKT